MEEQIRLFTDRLEGWMNEEEIFVNTSEENFEFMNNRILEIEWIIGEPPVRLSDQVDPNIWETIGSLLDVDINQELSSAPAWVNFMEYMRKLV